MDQQTKNELMRRFRERECTPATGGALPNHTAHVTPVELSRWIIDIVADARELTNAETYAQLEQLTARPEPKP